VAERRRPYGSGHLWTEKGKRGREVWKCSFYQGGRKIKRTLGPVRQPGSREGLTKTQAESKLRELQRQAAVVVQPGRTTLKEVGDEYIRYLEVVLERKRTTIQDYRIMLDSHFVPFFGERDVARIDADRIVAYMDHQRRPRKGKKTLKSKTIRNHVTFLHGIYRYAVKRRYAAANPVDEVDLPKVQKPANTRLQFLTPAELKELIRHIPDDPWGLVERVLYLMAALTGLRQGELLALQWRDIGWGISKVRVADNYTRGEFDDPKSREGRRAPPMADELATELERHFQRSAFTADDDLIFCHPELGTPLDPSKLRGRFYEALERADLHRITFHELRHTFGTQMAAAGTPPRMLQEWMGHANQKTTEIYSHYAPDPTGGKVFVERAFGPGDEPENTDADGRDATRREDTSQA
jgi:integrase